MGIVYLAQPRSGSRKLVAIKALHPEFQDNDEARTRFISEIESLRVLQHPHIIPLLDSNTEGSLIWFAMPFYPRGTLKDVLRQGKRFTAHEVARLLGQVADAIDYAHDQKYLHRDIKPDNILLDEHDNAILTDFGIAKREDSDTLTNPGFAMGTPKYMSRARKMGAPATRKTDVYALGVIIYQLLSGDIKLTRIDETWVYASIPASVMEIVSKAVAEREEDTFASAGEFARAFADALGEPQPDDQADAEADSTADGTHVTANFVTPRIARSVVEAISRSVQVSNSLSQPPRGQRVTVSIILALCSVIVFGVVALMLRPEFGFLSLIENATSTTLPSPVDASPLPATQAAQAPTVTLTPLPSATTIPPTTLPISVPTEVVPPTTLPTLAPTEPSTETATVTPLPPTFTLTWTFTPSPIPPSETPLPSATSTPTFTATFTAIPPTVTPSPTPAYYQRKTILLNKGQSLIPFDMLSLPSSTPCIPIRSAEPAECTGKTLWIDLIPVSVSQYRFCVDRGDCSLYSYASVTGPIIGLSWLNAANFCNWRGGRLPTDEEIMLLMSLPSEIRVTAFQPEWLGVDKQGALIASEASAGRAAVWDGTIPFQLAQMVDEAIEMNRDFAFRCVVYQP